MTDTPGSSTAQTLRAVSDSIVDDLAMLAALESSKRALEPDDPKLVKVTREIERLAARVLGSTTAERQLVEDAYADAVIERPGESTASIDATPPRSPRVVLEAWRDAERQAAAAEPGSAEAVALAEQIERLRAEYRASR
jgi:hypothetical protein